MGVQNNTYHALICRNKTNNVYVHVRRRNILHTNKMKYFVELKKQEFIFLSKIHCR